MPGLTALRRAAWVAGVVVVLAGLASCGPRYPLGMSEAEWNALTPQQRLDARGQQAQIDETRRRERAEETARQRAEEQRLAEQKAFQERQLVQAGLASPGSVDWDRFEKNSRVTVIPVDCASQGGQTAVCDVGGRIEAARLVAKYSRAPCRYGESWGHGEYDVWASRGCRARFDVAVGFHTLVCESERMVRNTCRSAVPIGRAQVHQQRSTETCVEGRNWGVADGAIWVDQGCRAEFRVFRAPSSRRRHRP